MFFLNIFAFALFCIVSPDNTTTIPLDEIWALDMPGTKPIRELLKDPKDDNSLVGEIARTLCKKYGKEVGPAFIVSGDGAEALKNTHAIITGMMKRSDKVPHAGTKSIFFFTNLDSRYIHVTKVDMKEGSIKIYCRETPHETSNMTVHFALIPLGKLHKGIFNVEIVSEPLEKGWADRGLKPYDEEKRKKKYCSSFKFEVI